MGPSLTLTGEMVEFPSNGTNAPGYLAKHRSSLGPEFVEDF
jgi:hypothetical protein